MYSNEEIERLTDEYNALLREYHELIKTITIQGQSLTNDLAKEYILHGASRRISVLRRSVENIFRIFPLETIQLLQQDDLYDVQINLHAFVMNLYGVFENCAWAFVIYHDLKEVIGDRNRISLFKKETKKHLPEPIISYLRSQSMIDWHKYILSYRDSLAHRIPLYIPPSAFTEEDSVKYRQLQEEQMECFRKFAEGYSDTAIVDRTRQIFTELSAIGSPCPAFLHSLTEDEIARQMLIHPQLICDSRTIIEFTNLFLQEWKTKRKNN